MERIWNLKWVIAVVIVLTTFVAIGVAAWRSSGGSQRSGATHPNQSQETGKEAGPDHHRQEHK
ncbi:MAG: hypothetical protein HYX68_17105 [Planctomycetes bacterium]|nr:hypothetical protein [Planctomycetota bacterium]